MPVQIRDMPRPAHDNGRGLHGFPRSGWTGGEEGFDYWIDILIDLGIKWFKVLDNGCDSLDLCERLIASGIFPIVRILRSDPPPNDTPEPNPGHIGDREEKSIRRLLAAGVRYFETNNEPDLVAEWKHGAIPGDISETARLVALNWLFDARIILETGGLPALPAVSSGSDMDMMGALVALGRQDILLEGCWIALHNLCRNRPLAYPDDPVNRSGQMVTAEQYDIGPLTPWVWWNADTGRVDGLEQINTQRDSQKKPTGSILEDHACFRAFEYYDHLANNYLGRSIPIISTDGGYLVGRRQDPRYGRVTPELHRDQTVAMFDFMQRQAPDYYFAAVPRLLISDPENDADAWISTFWATAFHKGADSHAEYPPFSVPEFSLAERLPVVDAVKSMPRIARQSAEVEQIAELAVVTEVSEVAISVSETPHLRYVVARGDTLGKIASRYGTTPDAIAAANQIIEAKSIRPGQMLLIPPTSTLHPGDTMQEYSEWEESDLDLPALQLYDESEGTPSEVFERQIEQADLQPNPAMEAETVTESGQSRKEETDTEGESTAASATESEKVKGTTEAATGDDTTTEHSQRHILSTESAAAVQTPSTPDTKKDSGKVLDWDPRLDALHITLVPAQVAPGVTYWRLVRAEYLGPSESGGKHQIFYCVEDEQGEHVQRQRVWQGWPEDKTDASTNDKGRATIPLWASFVPERGESGPYSAWVDGLPSDRVGGMGLPSKRHVSFSLTWRRVRV